MIYKLLANEFSYISVNMFVDHISGCTTIIALPALLLVNREMKFEVLKYWRKLPQLLPFGSNNDKLYYNPSSTIFMLSSLISLQAPQFASTTIMLPSYLTSRVEILAIPVCRAFTRPVSTVVPSSRDRIMGYLGVEGALDELRKRFLAQFQNLKKIILVDDISACWGFSAVSLTAVGKSDLLGLYREKQMRKLLESDYAHHSPGCQMPTVELAYAGKPYQHAASEN